MSLISKILYNWHLIKMNYHRELVDSCLDHKLKQKLRNKLEYHKKKVEHFKGASI
ncbi:MAG TPA: hypothetical protein VEY70_04125 [Metabacillus sp.]|nr:hypothetical protein [Metabacillus sp.]